MEKLKYELNPKNYGINLKGGSFWQVWSLRSAGRSMVKANGNSMGFRPVFNLENK